MTPAEVEQSIDALLARRARRRGRPRDGRQTAGKVSVAVLKVECRGYSRRAAVRSVARAMGITERHVCRQLRIFWLTSPKPACDKHHSERLR